MLRMLQSDKTWKPLKIRVYPKRTWWSFPKRRRLICKTGKVFNQNHIEEKEK